MAILVMIGHGQDARATSQAEQNSPPQMRRGGAPSARVVEVGAVVVDLGGSHGTAFVPWVRICRSQIIDSDREVATAPSLCHGLYSAM